MRNREQVTARLFFLKEFNEAVKHKEETGGLLFRVSHPTFGAMYEVRYLPPQEDGEVKYQRMIWERNRCLKNWPYWIHFYINGGTTEQSINRILKELSER